MKFLIIQENGRHEKNRSFRECFSIQKALRNKSIRCDVWGLGHDNFKDKIDFNQYDVIMDLENYDDKRWVPDISKVKSYKVIWDIDSHVKGLNYYYDKFKKNKCDLMLHSTLDSVKKDFSLWFPNCFDDNLIKPLEIKKRADIGFCGNIVNRKGYIDFLKKNFNFISDIFVIGQDMVNAINSYKIHFNKNISNDINYRNFETVGCRIPLVTNRNYQYAKLGFEDNKNCCFYENINGLSEKIKFLLDNDLKRNEIANAGFELAKKHTYDKRIDFLVEHLKTKI